MLNYYRLVLSLSLLLCVSFHSVAQMISPPTWTVELEQANPAAGEETRIIFKADIPENWYIYSNEFEDFGPIQIELDLEGSSGIERIGELKAVDPKTKYDDVWEGEVNYFDTKGEFFQTIRITDENASIKGLLEYQMCSEVTGQCILFDEEFEINLGEGAAVVAESAGNDAVDTKEAEDLPSKARPSHVETGEGKGSLITFMVVAFLAGLAALLTPCVFPMIPMTVTFFTGRSKNRSQGIRNAFIYGFSIIAIYTIAGTLVAAIQGPEFANWLSTHWVPNVFFFLVFIFFGLAFLGMFELTLPSGLVNAVDSKADKGGLTGLFFMAFTLVLVSFSCTGPIVGSILIESAGGQLAKPILGMFAFSLAFAIPFTLFAIFPEWLNTLPKSGGWLNSVKVVLGFLELALAFKFLSIADQVYHWGLLDRDVYIGIWIVIFFLLGMYLLGKIRLPHDSPVEVISVPRLLLAMVTFIFVVYMIPGLWGAPLKTLSGYLPPMSTHDFNLIKVIREDGGGSGRVSNLDDTPKFSEFLHLPHGIEGYFDYEQALAAAKRADKPLFIDFTGHGCVNCREMEAKVWVESPVLKRLKEDFVVVALYIDERYELPESDWYTSEYDGKVKKTIGKQNADFQITRFNNNAQPYYVILDHEEELLITPKGYDSNVSRFVQFLDEAKEEFERRR
ncbi:thioredoxin family protein [Litoribacter alkaliphilus]|uniref:Thioredoxin family protein n=1 Tax=Litoribacter ruber TaxID=702568 RepID=A0AAP2G223_9BACT|nr:cytochrome c biogenesis protein CcdA [Litoribacter alkaliphilus]MBS9525514.1 thioredoxin family protein [Litoribacter alkaliphilus]